VGNKPQAANLGWGHCQNMHQHKSHRFCPVNTFVNKSAKLVCPSSFPTRKIPAAAASLTARQFIALCFFANADSGMLAFFTTPLLSQNAFVGPSKGTPNIRNLHLNATINSLQIRNATNSLPNVADSTAFCRLLHQTMGALHTNRKIPVCDRRVATLPA